MIKWLASIKYVVGSTETENPMTVTFSSNLLQENAGSVWLRAMGGGEVYLHTPV